MRIPLWLLIFLPKSVQEESMQGRWCDRSDQDIKEAYMWAMDSFNMWSNFREPHNKIVTNAIAEDRYKLDTYILPQMGMRKLFVAPPKSKYGYIHGGEI
jgi:hypothetical protein